MCTNEREEWRCKCDARNPSTPVEVLNKLAKDKNSSVKYRTASNPNTPINTLEYLSKDENWDVRYCVASNSNTPINTLEYLSKDEDWEVRYYTASNPNTPVKILINLSKDLDRDVRWAAKKTLRKLRHSSNSISFIVKVCSIFVILNVICILLIKLI